jgi:hypothetical protein
MRLFDPWRDAKLIAERLQNPHNELHLVIGAESWCRKCQTIKPQWDQHVSRLPDDTPDVWLWLEIEIHAEFLQGFVPEDLPLYLRYAHINEAHVLMSIDEHRIQTTPYAIKPVPNLRTVLTKQDWAD